MKPLFRPLLKRWLAGLRQPAIWLCLVNLPPLLTAQQSLHFSPVFRNYSTDQGLPNNWIYAIEQDHEGYLWVSTDNGVCRFNGYRFEQFPDTLQANFTSVMSQAMMEDECGRMWWVDFQGRVFYEENNRIYPWSLNPLLDTLKPRFDRINNLIVGGCGKEFWFGMHNLGVLHIDSSGHWDVLLQPTNLSYHVFGKSNRSFSSRISNPWKGPNAPNAPIFFQTEQGEFTSAPFPFQAKRGIGMDYIGKLSQGRYLVGVGDYLYLFQNGVLLWYRYYDKTAAWVLEEEDGSLLIGHIREGGVARFASLEDLQVGKKAATFLEGLSISNIFKDREGGYWFGTQERGLFYCPSLTSGVAQGIPGMEEGIAKGVAADGADKLYFGLQNGRIFEFNLVENEGRDITPGTINFLYTLYFDPESMTLACAAEDLSFFREGKWLENSIYQLTRKNFSKTMGKRLAKVPGTDHWWSASPGALALDDWPNRQRLESTSDIWKKLERFYSVCLDPTGRLWVSTRIGLSEYKNHQLLRPEQQHPAFNLPIFDIINLPDSSLALAPKGYGVVIWKPGSPPRQFSEAQGLVSDQVFRLFAEENGTIWACTEHGASRISPDGRGGYRIENFTVKNGLPSNVVNQVAVAGGYYWFATDNGLLRLQEKPPVAVMSAPLFELVAVNGRSYQSTVFKGFSLPHDSSNISLEWASIHFRSAGQIQYRYRLRTGNTDTAWTLTTDRRANFANLASGTYQFEVAAQDETGQWSSTSALGFIIRPPWWATWWARSVEAFSLGLLVFGLYRYRTLQIRRENRMKEEMQRLERSALQAQMNPHFIFNCLNSIQNFILQNDALQATQYLSSFARLVRDTLNASVNGWVTLEEEIRMLNNYLALEKLRFKAGFDYAVETEDGLQEFDLRLPPLLIQPLVENAIIHGMKNKDSKGFIRVQFREEGTHLVATVTDNGAGLLLGAKMPQQDPSHRPVGMGITQSRIALLNQTTIGQALHLNTWFDSAGNIGGTKAELRIKIA